MVLASGMATQDPNPAGILTQIVIVSTPTHMQYLKWQVYIKANEIFIALIAKATFPKLSHFCLLIPHGYVQKSCCIKETQKCWLEEEPLEVIQPDLLWGADLCQRWVRSACASALPAQQK